jgi:hypothetical protein
MWSFALGGVPIEGWHSGCGRPGHPSPPAAGLGAITPQGIARRPAHQLPLGQGTCPARQATRKALTMLRIVEPDGTPIATAGCLSAAAEIMRHADPGWYHVLETRRATVMEPRAISRRSCARRRGGVCPD